MWRCPCILTMRWCPSNISCIGYGVCYDRCVLSIKLLAFTLLHFVLQGQACLLLQVSLDFCFCILDPCDKKDISLLLVLEVLWVSRELANSSFFVVSGWHTLGFPWRWMPHFWDCTQFLHFRLFIDYEGYSISSKGFLPIVVDIMVIWIKFTNFHPF